MSRFLVTWEMDIEGVTTPEQAARKAWEHMRREDSTANCFTVIDEHGDAVNVDLEETDQSHLPPRRMGDVLRSLQGRFGS